MRPDKQGKTDRRDKSDKPDSGPDLLVVAPVRRWVAEDFSGAAEHRGLTVLPIWVLDVPPLSGYTRPAWWTPTEHAARLLRAGVPLPLLVTDWTPLAR